MISINRASTTDQIYGSYSLQMFSVYIADFLMLKEMHALETRPWELDFSQAY